MTVARVDLETGEILADMTPDEARHITDRINDLADDMTALVLDAYERGAWKALGYSTWEEYAQTELKKSRRYSYNLIDHGRVVRAIEEVSGVRHGAHDISERAARQIKPRIGEVTGDIRGRIDGEPSWPSPERTRQIVRDELRAGEAERVGNVVTAQERLDEYREGLRILEPVMSADLEITVNDAVQRLLGGVG